MSHRLTLWSTSNIDRAEPAAATTTLVSHWCSEPAWAALIQYFLAGSAVGFVFAEVLALPHFTPWSWNKHQKPRELPVVCGLSFPPPAYCMRCWSCTCPSWPCITTSTATIVWLWHMVQLQTAPRGVAFMFTQSNESFLSRFPSVWQMWAFCDSLLVAGTNWLKSNCTLWIDQCDSMLLSIETLHHEKKL